MHGGIHVLKINDVFKEYETTLILKGSAGLKIAKIFIIFSLRGIRNCQARRAHQTFLTARLLWDGGGIDIFLVDSSNLSRATPDGYWPPGIPESDLNLMF